MWPSSLAPSVPRDKPPGPKRTTRYQLKTGTDHPPHGWPTEDERYMQTAHMRPFGLVDDKLHG